MSWSTRTPEAVAKGEIAPDEPQIQPSVEAEQRAQFEAAVEAAEILARVIGREGDRVHATLSGHANPGHAPAKGWSDECITVFVYAVPGERE